MKRSALLTLVLAATLTGGCGDSRATGGSNMTCVSHRTAPFIAGYTNHLRTTSDGRVITVVVPIMAENTECMRWEMKK